MFFAGARVDEYIQFAVKTCRALSLYDLFDFFEC